MFGPRSTLVSIFIPPFSHPVPQGFIARNIYSILHPVVLQVTVHRLDTVPYLEGAMAVRRAALSTDVRIFFCIV